MMRFMLIRRLIFGGAVLCGTLWVSQPAWAIDSLALIEKSARYDGRTVTFKGEVIGDIMRRRDGVWLNINDDAYSRQGPRFSLAGYNKGQGILIPKSQAAKITKVGNYRQRGDLVEVKGIFYAAAEQYGGQMMIEGKSLKIIKKGFPLESPISRRKLILLFFSTAAAVAVTILLRATGRSRH